jgi:hypothetical protein
LVKINEEEISYLDKKINSIWKRIEFNDFHHPYAYDLDIFGGILYSKTWIERPAFLEKKHNYLYTQIGDSQLL